MNKLLKRIMVFALSLAIVAAFTPALDSDYANADEADGFTVTKSYVKTGTSEEDAMTAREGTIPVKTYTQDEFESLATVGDETSGGPAYYMFSRLGDTFNVFKIHKGVEYETILSDAAGIESKDEINALAGIYSYNDKECTSLYGKLKTMKSQFLGSATYTYNDAKYDSATSEVELGNGTEVPGIMAISYDYSAKGLSADNPDKTAAELEDWSSDNNRMFLGVAYDAEGKMITGGFMSQTGANTGIDIVEYYDVKVTFDGDEDSAQYMNKDDVIDLPAGDWYYIDGTSYVKVEKGTKVGDIAGDSDSLNLVGAEFTVTKSYVKTGTSEEDAMTAREGTTIIKSYPKDEFESLATVGDETFGGPAYYMWTKNGESYNVYKIHKGVKYETILSDAAGIEGKDEINALAGIYSYNDKACTSLYGKLKTMKSQFLGSTTYTYDGAKYDSAAASLVLGDGTEVPGIMAISYDASAKGLSADNPDKTAAELDDWTADNNRMFLGVAYDAEGKMITGGFMSQTGANTGIDIVEYYDIKVTFNGDEDSAQYLCSDDEIDLPSGNWCYLAAPGYTKVKAGMTAGEIAGENDVIDLKSMPAKPNAKATTTYNSATVSWNKVKYADGYYVNGIDVGTKTSKKFTGLKTGKKYTYKVQAYRNFEDGSIVSSTCTVTAKPSLKKAVIKSARNIKTRAIKTTWKKVTGAKKYQVSITLKKSATKVVRTTNKLTFKKSKLKKGKTYYVKVRAVASNGAKGKWSAVKKVRIKK